MKVRTKDDWLIIKRTYWSGDNQENWFDCVEQANSEEHAESKKSALETLNNEKRVSYLIIKSKQLDQIKESEVDDDTIPF